MAAKSASYIKGVGMVGAFANWMIPVAAFASITDDPSRINPGMTSALAVYSLFFMRWSLAISPPNPALFACHVANEAAQLTQLFRYGKYAMSDKTEATPAAVAAAPSEQKK
ncbi:hypothetical protein CAOG_03656 [Capsaspora owczarzaki ATCC 30864]|uniref:Mitochondrial pyruvate carrier n=1 Tax=Capsaspora owczarzaki (strain ATCC 30864) TaxID=595528 RepID=A0A0D2VQ75_CAPO3|nr:hypothetical protein CAOG_03656 [Capsaspora owczarzaki ATCC 30864]KJE92747.1 hypothetical protein CAOG_003656 [Capsaspora owczarzaki ATCC 30864]|eukprot:XP_004363384.1 hypothetical protein CAOG_03656 [Capsaspora owczarzaki ATCC 30864]